jgi:uncharacterized DUF497 family protein
MVDVYNDANLSKNKVSRAEIDEVMRSPVSVWFPLDRSHRKNERVMVVGFTLSLRILEIGIEILSDDSLNYFHTMSATKLYRIKFEEASR